AHRLPAPHPLHHAGRLPLPRALRPVAPPPADQPRRRAIPGGPCLSSETLPLRVRGARRPSRRAGLAVALALAGGLARCTRDKAEPQQPVKRPAVTVAVAPVEQKTVPVQIQAIGSVEAYSVVQVRAQVGGELIGVHFKEGQDVKKGDTLFTIDPRPLEATLAQAEANLSKDRVQIQQARAVLERDRARVSQTRAALLRDQTQAANADVQAN